MEAFLKSQNVPDYISNLLDLAGISTVKDLLEIDKDVLVDIEAKVQQEGFKDQVDFESRQNRIKYFGINLASQKDFAFRLFDRKKLLKLPAAARTKYSADVVSYKRHVSRIHLEKGSELKEGAKMKKKPTSVSSYFSSTLGSTQTGDKSSNYDLIDLTTDKGDVDGPSTSSN